MGFAFEDMVKGCSHCTHVLLQQDRNLRDEARTKQAYWPKLSPTMSTVWSGCSLA